MAPTGKGALLNIHYYIILGLFDHSLASSSVNRLSTQSLPYHFGIALNKSMKETHIH